MFLSPGDLMTSASPAFHQPVLAAAVVALARDVSRVVDGTLGGGGHAALCRAAGAAVLGIDRDPEAIAAARRTLGEEGITYLNAPFWSPAAFAAIEGFRPDLILLDLGVSSHQLDAESRGFTFRPGARLDMRMAPTGDTAATLLNRAPEEELRRVFRDYGDEPRAARLAREVVRRRSTRPFETSDDLVGAIRATLGPRSGPPQFARLFQAVRIAVNDELPGLAAALPQLFESLPSGGRLAVISYHSGEDRIVKQAFRDWCRSCICPKEAPICTCRGRPLGRLDPPKPIRPTDAEIAQNPRARSATLRVFRKD